MINTFGIQGPLSVFYTPVTASVNIFSGVPAKSTLSFSLSVSKPLQDLGLSLSGLQKRALFFNKEYQTLLKPSQQDAWHFSTETNTDEVDQENLYKIWQDLGIIPPQEDIIIKEITEEIPITPDQIIKRQEEKRRKRQDEESWDRQPRVPPPPPPMPEIGDKKENPDGSKKDDGESRKRGSYTFD